MKKSSPFIARIFSFSFSIHLITSLLQLTLRLIMMVPLCDLSDRSVSCDQAKLFTSSPCCTSYLGKYSLPIIRLRKSLLGNHMIFLQTHLDEIGREAALYRRVAQNFEHD